MWPPSFLHGSSTDSGTQQGGHIGPPLHIVASTLLAARIRRGAELLAGLGHRGFEVGARLLPGVALDGNGAGPLALTVVDAVAALVLAGVRAGAAVGFGGGALALAGALVVAARPVALAGVQ